MAKKSTIAVLFLSLLLAVPAWSGSSTGTITFSPSGYLGFGTVSVGSISPQQTLTVTNHTKYQFAFTSVSAETGFSVASTNCVGVLQPGQACTVQVVFVPQHRGNYLSHLNLGTPYSPAAFTAVLYGSGQP